MFSKFEGLEDEKRERILKAAMKEFSDKGYDMASTNEIVKEAGIAKGLLFHYFQNKKQLFLYLYEYCVETILKDVLTDEIMGEREFFAKIRKSQRAKLALLEKYPEMFAFMQTAYLEESHMIKADMEQKNQTLILSASARMFYDIDRTKFKDGLDVQMAINIVLWSMEGYTNQYLLSLKRSGTAFDVDASIRDAERYFQLFQECFYK